MVEFRNADRVALAFGVAGGGIATFGNSIENFALQILG